MDFEQWKGFTLGRWSREVDVRDFIQLNYTPYEGTDEFLTEPTENTKKLWEEVLELYKKERENGDVLDVDTKTPSAINAYAPGYINKEFQEDPHMAVYIELFKKHFKITYINNVVIRKYKEFNSIDEIFSSIENTCKSLVEK